MQTGIRNSVEKPMLYVSVGVCAVWHFTTVDVLFHQTRVKRAMSYAKQFIIISSYILGKIIVFVLVRVFKTEEAG